MTKQAKVIEVEPVNVDIRIKCKCGKIFNDVDKDFNDWTECPQCHRQYKINFCFNEKDVELEEMMGEEK